MNKNKSKPSEEDVEAFAAAYERVKPHIPKSYYKRIESAIAGLFRKLIKDFK